MNNNLELISFEKIKHIKVFTNKIIYRTFHSHNAFEILLVLAGNAVICVNGKKIKLKSGDIAVVSPHKVHDILSNNRDGTTFLILQVSRNFLEDYLSNFKTTIFNDVLLTPFFSEEEANNLRNELLKFGIDYFSSSSEKDSMNILYKLLGILINIFNHVNYVTISEQEYLEHKKIIGRISRIAEYIEKNYQFKLTLEDIAKEENLSVNYVSQFFTKYIGVTFQKYLNNVRLEAALRLLIDNSLSISDVATYSGFADTKYMAIVFRRYFGCPPNEYRKHPISFNIDIPSFNKKENNTEFIFDRSSSLSLLNKALDELNRK